jgi:LCP family protein required for cell wall assembly
MFEHLDDTRPFRADDAFRASTMQRGRRLRRRRAVAKGATLCGASLLLLALGASLWADRQLDRVDRVDIGEEVLAPEPTEAPGVPAEPTYVLVVGVDGASSLVPGSPPEAPRSDTTMLVRADPGGRLSVLSVPRDLWVSYGDDEGRVNEALGRGGPEELIRAISDTLEVPVHHYLQLDMAGFTAVVDQVGGVDVDFPAAMRDRSTGLSVGAGCTTLDGAQALALVRSRHTEVLDPATALWTSDPSGDLGRVVRQRQFVDAAVQGIVALEPTPDDLQRLLATLAEHAVLDEAFSDAELLDWSRWLISRGEENVTSYDLPVEPGNVGAASVLFLADGWEQVVDEMRAGVEPTPPPPGDVRSAYDAALQIAPC